jgi:raffinose/stachyose/melibiose transport system permease protein
LKGEGTKNAAIQALLLLNAFVMLYPLFVMAMSAFKSNAEIFASRSRCRKASPR